MKPAKLVISLLFLLLVPVVLGAIVYDIIVPADYYETTGTSVLFNWSVNSTSPIDNPMPSYLFITTNLSDENQFFLNYTKRYCLNYSYQTSNNTCDTTVTGFVPGHYQWYVVTGEAAVAPTVMSTNAYPYDTRDRSANVTSTNAETYDTRDRVGTLTSTNGISYNTSAGNDTIDITYMNASTTEVCNVTLEQHNILPVANVTASINSACNLTAAGTGNFTITTKATGITEWIYIDSGNATGVLGLTTGTNYTGSANNTVGLNYTVAGATTKCEVSLAKSATLSSSDAFDNITAVCDLQGNGDTYVNLNTNSTGINEFIIFANGSALGLLGFTAGVNYTGTANNTLDLTYSVNGTVETCNVSLTKDSQWNTTDIITNMTQASNQCNLTLTNTTFLILNGSGYGEEEYITIASGSVLSILGLTVGTTYGSQINTTSDSRWFEVQDSAPTSNYSLFRWINGSGFISMWLNKDTGDLSIAGKFSGNLSYGNISSDSFPSACPSGAITNLDGAICTDSWVDTLGETDSVIFNGGNVTNMSMINILPQSAAPGGAVEGDVYYDSDLDELCFYNATAWIGVITHGACT